VASTGGITRLSLDWPEACERPSRCASRLVKIMPESVCRIVIGQDPTAPHITLRCGWVGMCVMWPSHWHFCDRSEASQDAAVIGLDHETGRHSPMWLVWIISGMKANNANYLIEEFKSYKKNSEKRELFARQTVILSGVADSGSGSDVFFVPWIRDKFFHIPDPQPILLSSSNNYLG
jgi:hypothetical protein